MSNFIVVSASSGIGQAVVKTLESAGHKVFKTARNNNTITPDSILDATDFDAVDAVFKTAMNEMGGVDGVVNCAGSLLLKPAHLTNRAQYDDVISASLTTSFAVARAAGKNMTGGGSVVFVSSAAAMEGLSNHDAIAAAKAGIIGLTLSCAASYATNNLRFNAVAPGLTDTPLTKSIFSNDTSLQFSKSMHALGRLGTADDIARAIAFFLNPENNWITGQVLAVDGGLSCIRPKAKA